MARIAIDKNGVLARGTLQNVLAADEWNFINLNIACVGILLSGIFSTGTIQVNNGINLGFLNPQTKVIDPSDGTSSDIVYGSPGLYIQFVFNDTLLVGLTGGEIAVTDIDYVIFMPALRTYWDSHAFGTIV